MSKARDKRMFKTEERRIRQIASVLATSHRLNGAIALLGETNQNVLRDVVKDLEAAAKKLSQIESAF